MKRSEAIKKLIPKVISPFEVILKDRYDFGVYEERAKALLSFIEKELGMRPPSVPAKTIRGDNHRWGGGCSMRCDCDECNPNYPMYVWEPE